MIVRTWVAYAKPGTTNSGEVKVTLHIDNESFSGPPQPYSIAPTMAPISIFFQVEFMARP